MREEKMRNNSRLIFKIVFSLLVISMIMYVSRGRCVYEGDRALYLDDMSEHDIMTNPDTSVWEKITDTSANKVRYVTNTFMYVLWGIVGTNYDREDVILFIFNVLTMALVWLSIYMITGAKRDKCLLIPFGGALVFTLSRFAYYSYEEFFGIMENLAIIFAAFFLVYLVKDGFRFSKYYWMSLVLYFLNIYVHERYIVLAGTLVIYIIFASFYNSERIITRENLTRIAIIVGIVGVVLVHRFMLFGDRMADGTGGTSAKDTFSLPNFFMMFAKAVLYSLGINAPGDAYLNGIDPRAVNGWIYFFTVTVWCFLIYLLYWGIRLIKDRKFWMQIFLFFISILCLLVISSSTIRVEMRWIYSCFMFEILAITFLLSRVLQTVKDKGIKHKISEAALISLFLVLFIEEYYSNHWNHIYNWGSRVEAAALSDQFDKHDVINNLYIIDQGRESTDDIVHLGAEEGKEIKMVQILKNFMDVESVGENDVVLLKDENNAYVDITENYKSLRFEQGHYDDGWCEPYVRMSVYAQKKQEVFLSIYIPDYSIIGQNKIKVLVNGRIQEIIKDLNSDSISELNISGFEEGRNEIEIISGFNTISDSGRSEDGRLSYVLTQALIQ